MRLKRPGISNFRWIDFRKKGMMQKLLWIVGSTIGGAVGWWLGEMLGLMYALVLSLVGALAGVYAGVKIGRQYLD